MASLTLKNAKIYIFNFKTLNHSFTPFFPLNLACITEKWAHS